VAGIVATILYGPAIVDVDVLVAEVLETKRDEGVGSIESVLLRSRLALGYILCAGQMVTSSRRRRAYPSTPAHGGSETETIVKPLGQRRGIGEFCRAVEQGHL
jgi:hypothetical protein